jgi:hypothetical protein
MRSSPSIFPKFYNPCIHVLQTCKSCKMYSWVLFDSFTSWDNDRDHVHVFYIFHTMVLLWVKDLTFLLPNIAQRLGTHSYDVIFFYIMCTTQLPSSPYLFSDSTKMLGSLDLLSTLPRLDLYVYIDFPPIARLLENP